MLVQLSAQVPGDPLAQDGHQPQTHYGRRLADHVHERHRRDCEPGDRAGAADVQPAFLRRPDYAVDHIPGEVGRHQAYERDQRRRRHPERELPAVRREIAEQPTNHRHPAPGHEGLGIAHRPRDARCVLCVRVRSGDAAPLERLLQHELQVFESAPLAMAVAQHRERDIAGTPEDRERGGRQTGCLTHRLDAGALHAFDLPLLAAVHPPGHGQAPGPERDPHLSEPQGVV